MYISLLYDLIFFAMAIVYAFMYLFKGKFHKDFGLRLGILPKNLDLGRPVWVHAVSVGEMMSVRNFIEGLRKSYPDRKFVISTVTPTGNKIARGSAKDTDFITYLPLDFSFIVSKVIKRVNPLFVVIAETEIWPNFIFCLRKNNIPVVVVNARISDKSFSGYKKIKFLIKPVLNKISLFCAQTQTDAQRLICLGVNEDKIKVTGNMKFDNTDYTDFKKDCTDLKIQIGLQINDKLWVAASTHQGEEEIVLNVYKRLLADYPRLKLLIAPRHPDRAKEIEKLINRYNFSSVCISQLNLRQDCRGLCSRNDTSCQVFILDAIGELMSFYQIADIVFVGGSLVKKGGHNILEPASFAKPIIFGPYMFNFRDISELFITNDAAVMVENKDELCAAMKELLVNKAKVDSLGEKARNLIEQNRKATQINIDSLKEIL